MKVRNRKKLTKGEREFVQGIFADLAKIVASHAKRIRELENDLTRFKEVSEIRIDIRTSEEQSFFARHNLQEIEKNLSEARDTATRFLMLDYVKLKSEIVSLLRARGGVKNINPHTFLPEVLTRK